MAPAQDKQKEYSDKKILLDTKNLPLKVVSSVESNKLKHRFIGPFAVLVRHGAAYTIDLKKSIATHRTFYVGRLKRYHDVLGPPSQMEGGHGESSSPRNQAESSGQPELPVSKSVHDTQTGIHASHTKGMMVPNGKNLGKNYTHKPSGKNLGKNNTHKPIGTSNPAAHKRASDQIAPPAPLDRNGELHYHVERVVQERRRSGKRQLLVKWRGYPSSQNSWEPKARLRVSRPKLLRSGINNSRGVNSPRLLSCLTVYGRITVYGPWIDGTVPALILSAGLRLQSKSLH
ncbi:Hypothetical protein PHPALM_7384 [Phytophthora palmivora]|uniref:Chromo domain-containing protein n=1 Tax=Phytophthora palmivora TaxID=4796 RepID=A0A2P4YCG8_9STRA|nr:Hypothetical protein PHPALM_7384 [Phytophthora palmivora]